MLKEFEARGLNKRISVPKYVFSDDINLLTGTNGSGKTTVLKLLWYLVSGNLERIPREMNFEYIYLKTSDFEITLECEFSNGTIFTTLIRDGKKHEMKTPLRDFMDEPPQLRRLNELTGNARHSVFFPTFRRIEGGFSLIGHTSDRPRIYFSQLYSSLERALNEISRALTVAGHQFVFSVSTSDIVNLLTSKYADVSQRTNSEQAELVAAIISEIEQQGRLSDTRPINDSELLASAHDAIAKIRHKATEYGERQAKLLQPFTTLSKFIEAVFADKGITISSGLILGVGPEKISSDLLSAGEKQILSFLVYNAFAEHVPIFIDEPEMSLHVDWQRILFPTLLEQNTGNQFIVATHSPFIYSKYADKEMALQRAGWQ